MHRHPMPPAVRRLKHLAVLVRLTYQPGISTELRERREKSTGAYSLMCVRATEAESD